jgi:hypothetical protein
VRALFEPSENIAYAISDCFLAKPFVRRPVSIASSNLQPLHRHAQPLGQLLGIEQLVGIGSNSQARDIWRAAVKEEEFWTVTYSNGRVRCRRLVLLIVHL